MTVTQKLKQVKLAHYRLDGKWNILTTIITDQSDLYQ